MAVKSSFPTPTMMMDIGSEAARTISFFVFCISVMMPSVMMRRMKYSEPSFVAAAKLGGLRKGGGRDDQKYEASRYEYFQKRKAWYSFYALSNLMALKTSETRNYALVILFGSFLRRKLRFENPPRGSVLCSMFS